MAREATLIAALLGLLALGAAAAGDSPSDEAVAALPERYRQFLEDVELLISEVEREVFLSLGEDYQRDHFIRSFWKVRDPFRQTGRNELKDAWEVRVARAREEFEDMGSSRAQMMLTFGPPTTRNRLTCTGVLEPLEVWEYHEGSDRIRGYFTLIFVGLSQKARGHHTQWEPVQGLSRLVSGIRSSGGGDQQLAQMISRECKIGRASCRERVCMFV